MNLNAWNYLVIGCKALFGGVPSVAQYLAKLLNDKVLSHCDADDICKWAQTLNALASFLDRLTVIFLTVASPRQQAALAVVVAVRSLGDKLSDGHVSEDEITAAVADVSSAIASCRSAFSVRRQRRFVRIFRLCDDAT